MLNRIAEGVFEVTSELRMGPGFYLPVRSTVLTLENGELAVISPVKMSDETVAQIDAVGRVTHLVAPNLLHHLFLGPAIARWPGARIHGVKGLARKRADLTFHEVLGENEAALGQSVACVALEGAPQMNEVVLLHKPSRTLVVTDLIFNIQEPKGALTALFLRIMGTYRRLNVSRLVRLAMKDRARVAASTQRIASLDFDRLIVAHGAILETDAKRRLAPIFQWLLGNDVKVLPLATT